MSHKVEYYVPDQQQQVDTDQNAGYTNINVHVQYRAILLFMKTYLNIMSIKFPCTVENYN